MRPLVLRVLFVVVALAAASPASPSISFSALQALEEAAPDPVLLAAGDIAACDSSGDEATAAILDGYPDATVATLGDNVYPNGTVAEFATCYEPSWGRHKTQTRPSPGNHDYGTPGASGYHGYFGAAAGPVAKGWYSYDLGSWHVVVLNSNCAYVECGSGSEQVLWLRADLAAHPADCTIAYWHHPRFTSGTHAGEPELAAAAPFWNALYEYGADLVLAGHDHDYERFAPQTPAGQADSAYGIREFVVGTGGRSLRGFGTPAPNSEVRDSSAFGVLKVVLREGAYDWTFLAEAGKTFTDAGTGSCHPPPDGRPPESNPTISSSHPAGWSNDNTVEVTWTGASDSGSGVDGFSYDWTQQPDSAPDLVKDAEETAGSATSPPLADGEWWFHLRTGDNAGNWSAPVHHGPFRIDTAPPANPSLSASHTAACSADATVDVTWAGATDSRSGVDGYSFEWSRSSTATPDLIKDAEEGAGAATSSTLADGEWWFHLRTRDNAANWSSPVHVGPFCVDTAAPANPTLATTRSADWLPDDTVEVTWAGATDGGSGVDGYSLGWTQSATTTPDDTKDAEETAEAETSPSLADGEWWFHLRTLDNAGNWSPVVHLGPFRVDRAIPVNPTLDSPSHTPGAWSNDATVEVSWSGASDAHSGVDGFSYAWTQQPGSNPDETKEAETATGSAISPTLTDGDWWFHLRTRDSAGNWSGAVHIGPFRIDTVAPTNPTISSPSHQVGVWSNDATVVVQWSGNTGETYSYEWSASEEAEPDTTPDGPATRIESIRPDGASWFHLRTYSGQTGRWSHPSHVGPFLIDTVPPETLITSGPSGSVTTTSATFTFTSVDGAAYDCSLDGSPLAPCTSPTTYHAVGYGFHVFRVRATDEARNVDPTPAERRWTVEEAAAPPPPPGQPQPPPVPQPQPEPPPPVTRQTGAIRTGVTVASRVILIGDDWVARLRIVCSRRATTGCRGRLLLQALVSSRQPSSPGRAGPKSRIRVASATFRLNAGRAAVVRAKLNRAGRRLLAKATLRGRVVVVARDASGATHRGSRSVTLRRSGR